MGSDDAETILLKAALLQVICLYQQVVPHVVMQYNFDFSKLLKGACPGTAAGPLLLLPVGLKEVRLNRSRVPGAKDPEGSWVVRPACVIHQPGCFHQNQCF